MPEPKKRDVRSPLYTSAQARAVKLSVANSLGPDSDGAYRTRNRLDGKDKETRE